VTGGFAPEPQDDRFAGTGNGYAVTGDWNRREFPGKRMTPNQGDVNVLPRMSIHLRHAEAVPRR